MQKSLNIMVLLREPPVNDVSSDKAQTECCDADINDHWPLAEREGASCESQRSSNSRYNGQAKGKHNR